MRIPATLDWWHDAPGGTAWLERLPGIVEGCADRWSLEIGEPLEGGAVALVASATTVDGRPVVLKISFPDDESRHEPDALAHWDGRGVVRLLDRDDERRAMLLERVSPGTPLWEVVDDEEATVTAARALCRLHGAAPPAPVHSFGTLAEAAARWSETIPADWRAAGRACPADIVDAAVDACRTLGESTVDDALLHQDFHGGNVLRSGSDEWLVIDPKPLVGDPAFDAASLLRDRRWLLRGAEDARRRLRRRLDVLVDVAGLDRERMRQWGIVHALAWGVSATKLETDMLRCAEILAEL